MSNTTTAVVEHEAKPSKESAPITYVPFGAKEPIELTIALIKTGIAVPTKRGAQPTNRDCYLFGQLCKARGLNPFEGDAFLIGYDSDDGPKFSCITAHQAFLKRAVTDDNYAGMTSGVIVRKAGNLVESEGDFFDDGEVVVGAWATVHFKDAQRIPLKRRIRMDTYRKTFGLWKNPSSAAAMLVKCAEADALRSAYPNSLGGLYLADEVRSLHVVEVESEVKGQVQRAIPPKTVVKALPSPIPSFEAPVVTPEPEPVASAPEPEPEPAVKQTHAPEPPPAQPEPAAPAPETSDDDTSEEIAQLTKLMTDDAVDAPTLVKIITGLKMVKTETELIDPCFQLNKQQLRKVINGWKVITQVAKKK